MKQELGYFIPCLNWGMPHFDLKKLLKRVVFKMILLVFCHLPIVLFIFLNLNSLITTRVSKLDTLKFW